MIKVELNNFSVSMSVYANDNPNHFVTAVESVYNQSLIPSEVVLVIDGPISNEINVIIHKFIKVKDNFRVVRLKENKGHAYARRIGLDNCNHDIVALMDSDDISVSNRFEIQMKILLSDPEISVVGAQIEEFEDNVNEIIGSRIVPLLNNDILDFMKYRCPMNQVTVMFRKKDVLSVGGYLDWYSNEDYYLWVRMILAKLSFKNVEESLVKVRVNNNMYKRRGGWRYFKSEAKLQKFMYDNDLINLSRFIINTFVRLVVQVLVPNNLRRVIFVKLFRKQ